MVGLAFDTLAMARRLKKVGIEEAQADAIAECLRDAVTGSVAKQDLDAAKAALWEEIVAHRAETTAHRAETGVLKRLMVFLVGLVVLLVGQMFVFLMESAQ